MGLALAAAAGCTGAAPSSSAPQVRPVLLSPAPTPAPTARLVPVPRPGTVSRAAGPFDDRYRLAGTRLVGRTVTSRLTVTSDVSELIDLEVTADCYDAAGALLGSARQVVREGDGASGHASAERGGTPLRLTCRPGASSAVLSVPVLVNE